MMVPALEFQNVTKTYRRWLGGQQVAALSQVSFSLAEGEVCAFLISRIPRRGTTRELTE